MYVGSDIEFKVWLNGTLIYEDRPVPWDTRSWDYTDFSQSRFSRGEMSC